MDVVLSSATLLTVLAAGVWAYFRFSREGAHKPRIEFDLDCAFFGPQNDAFVKFDRPYGRLPNSTTAIAFLTDPWGTYIELTENLAPPK